MRWNSNRHRKHLQLYLHLNLYLLNLCFFSQPSALASAFANIPINIVSRARVPNKSNTNGNKDSFQQNKRFFGFGFGSVFAYKHKTNMMASETDKMLGTGTGISEEPPAIQNLIDGAKALYQKSFPCDDNKDGNAAATGAADGADDDDKASTSTLLCAIAPGRVNLIGEHTDYTAGYVFPMAIEFSTVCIGRGAIVQADQGHCRIISVNKSNANADADHADANANANANANADHDNDHNIVEFQARKGMKPLPINHPDSWSNYVAGVVNEYTQLLPPHRSFSFTMAINGNVPLGSGLSSSAALEVAVATFLESIMLDDYANANAGDYAGADKDNLEVKKLLTKKEKAVRCQRAENVYCHSPCGIMDQYVSSTASQGSAILIDCRSLEYESVQMGCGGGTSVGTGVEGKAETKEEPPVFIVCNSNVKHSIGGGEYPVRVQQCQEATNVLKAHINANANVNTNANVGDSGERIQTLRDATLDDVESVHKNLKRKREDSGEGTPATTTGNGNGYGNGEEKKEAETETASRAVMTDLIYKRAKHVVTENARTLQAKHALISGDWTLFGKLMNESHESMKVDYEVSCDEIDFLVNVAQAFEGVYGSRLTGGGFGGCTVTLVEKGRAEALCEHLRKEYSDKWDGMECMCFETSPGPGARAFSVELD